MRLAEIPEFERGFTELERETAIYGSLPSTAEAKTTKVGAGDS